MSACHEGESYIVGQNHFLFHAEQSLRSPVLVGAGAGCKKRMVETIYYAQTHNILPGLAVRFSRYLPRKAARARMTSQGERFGTEGSIPSLGTKRSDAHDSTTSRMLHQKGGRVPPTRPETG